MANTLNLGNGNWATKEDSLLAYNSENGNFKPLAFDFTRASSATVVNKAGLIETVGSGEPKIDFSNDANGSLLLEPSRSNYIPYSTLDFDGGVKPNGWSIGFGTGSYSYEQLTYKGQKAVKQTQITTGRSYLDTGSITILANTEHTLKIQFILNECVADANDNILSFISFGASVIYKFSDIDSNGVLEIQFNPLTDNIGSIRIGLGVDQNATGSKSLAWAIPQLEQGSYATSYIPTSGSAVTRSADVCNNGGNEQVINSEEGVLYAEISALANDGAFRAISLNNGSVSNRVSIRYNSTLNQIQYQYTSGGSVQVNITYNVVDVKTPHKIAVKYKLNDFELFIDGISRGTDLIGNVMPSGTLTNLDVNGSGVFDYFYGNIKDIRVYNTALTNAELISLTKI